MLTNRQPAAVNVSFSEAVGVYEARYDLMTAHLLTFQVHSGLKTFPEAAGWTVLSADLINDAVVPPCTQVVVLACEVQRKLRKRKETARDMFYSFTTEVISSCFRPRGSRDHTVRFTESRESRVSKHLATESLRGRSDGAQLEASFSSCFPWALSVLVEFTTHHSFY